jgi:hypothetical protein
MAEVVLHMAHRAPGRVRLHAPSMVHNTDEARRLADVAAAIPGVSKVEARSTTGSLIVFHVGDWAEIGEKLGEALGGEIADIEEAPAGGANAMDSASALIDALDLAASRAFGRRTDLSELTFLGLLAAGAVQLARGEVFGPAATLFGQAFALMAAQRSRRGRGDVS